MSKLSKDSVSGLGKVFSVKKTELFKIDMDNALRTMELLEVMKVLVNYKILKYKESKEFLDGFNDVIASWKNLSIGSVIVDKVQTRKSLCSACEFGKDMIAYEFNYQHTEAPEPYNRIIYVKEFGMLYDVRNGILHDIRICNAFLNRAEMNNLR